MVLTYKMAIVLRP